MVDNEFVQCSSFTERIQETSSRVQKASILLESRNEIIAFFLRFLLDKNITTGISTAKINKKLRKELNPDIDMGFFDVCRYISENPANDDTLWVVQSYIAKVGAKSKDKEFANINLYKFEILSFCQWMCIKGINDSSNLPYLFILL